MEVQRLKTQLVRIIDVIVLGPFLVYTGSKKSTLPNFFRAGLILSGVLTIGYNAKNYLAERRAGTGNSFTPGSTEPARYDA